MIQSETRPLTEAERRSLPDGPTLWDDLQQGTVRVDRFEATGT